MLFTPEILGRINREVVRAGRMALSEVYTFVWHLFLMRLRLALEWAVHGLHCNTEQHAAAPLPLVCEPAGGDPEHRLRPNRRFLGRLENPKLPKE